MLDSTGRVGLAVEDDPRCQPELLCQGLHGRQRHVALGALDAGEVPRGDLQLLGELLLGESSGESNGAQLLAERCVQR